MARMQARDEGGFEELYDRHAPRMLGLISRIVSSRAEADELLQEVWLHVWQSCDRYDPKRGTVAAWLIVVARSRALDQRRKLSNRDEIDQRLREQRVLPLRSAVSQEPESGEVVSALHALPDDERQVLEAAYLRGLTQREIAVEFDTPLGTVKTWMRRGIQRLRRTMERGELGA
ncbi:MAG: sigma-70 family RNA polymerase sigma factor [Planctomycetota bacterium]